jgi:hypothetical protein
MGNETVGKVSSIRSANTLFEGQQINGHREEKRRHKHREERNRRAIKDTDQGRSKQQIQRGTRTAPRYDVTESEYIVNRNCSDDQWSRK